MINVNGIAFRPRCIQCLTLSPMTLSPPPYPTALGTIGPSKSTTFEEKKPVFMMSARSDQI